MRAFDDDSDQPGDGFLFRDISALSPQPDATGEPGNK
jgi:hypothetical protein